VLKRVARNRLGVTSGGGAEVGHAEMCDSVPGRDRAHRLQLAVGGGEAGFDRGDLAEREAWLGEVEGIDLTLTYLRQKREETKRLTRIAPVELGIPGVAAPG
jgi:hypothetical protein